MNVDQAKHVVRERMWDLLERRNAVPGSGARGRIPNFVGAREAAERLAALPEWKAARVIKAVPDRAQYPVRQHALQDGKLLYMAVPMLAEELPFCVLDPMRLSVPPAEAASKDVARRVADRIGTDQMRPIDIAVCGSVVVDRRGTRLGKGAGYSDIELALLQEAGLLTPDTIIATTVHHLQVANDDDLPETTHDFRVDLIVTPEEVIQCESSERPSGLIWEHLDSEKISAIPVLAGRRPLPP
jgi:5-formyltetrahydrofolate cyclo-ligase